MMRSLFPAFAAVLGLVGSVLAQQPTPPVVTPPPPAVSPVAAAPAPMPPAAPQDKKLVRERERTIYVPYEELEKTFKDGGKGVFLPYKEFLELWNELTLKRKADEVKPPQDGVVSKAEYTGRVEGETLIIDAKITVQSFKEGWLTVPLAKGRAVPGIAEADTGKAVLNSKQDGYDVILPDKGIYELKMKIYAPVKKSAGKLSVQLALPQAAVSRFTATVPETGWEFKVEPAAAFTARPAGAGTELSFFFGSGTVFDVTWSKPEAATALAPLLLASSAVTAEVHAGSLATKAAVDFRILRAPVPSFTFLLPADQTVQSVSGDDVKDWSLAAAGDKQKLTINPNAPVKDKWSVKLALEAPLPKLPGEVVVPEIVVEGATQDHGDISIAAEAQLDVSPKPSEGLVQQTQSASPAQGLSAVGGYRFLKHPAKLTLGVAEAKPQVDVDSLTVLTVKRDSSRVEATFNYNIRRVGVFEGRVALPAGWTGWEVVGMAPDTWSIEKSGNAELLIVKFAKQTLGAASFSIRAQQQRATPTDDAVVPTFAPQGVVRHDAKIGVGVHSSLEVNTKTNGDLRLDDVNAIGSSLQLTAGNTYSGGTFINAGTLQIKPQQSAPAPADTELTLAFRHRGEVKTPATLSFKARDPQVNVQVLTLMEAKEQSLRHTWTLVFDIAYAATDRLIIAVPKSVAGDIRFADPNVKEVHKDFKADAKLAATLPGAADFVLWEVILRNERMGDVQLGLSVEKPLAEGKEAKLDLLQVHCLGVFQETGQVAVIKDDSLEIRDSKAESLDDIDPKELHGPLQRGGVFLAYKYKTQPIKLGLSVVRNAYMAVPQSHVDHAVLTTAVSTDRAQTTEAVYWVKNNAQQFLTVQLPKGARLVSDVFVSGATQQPMHREGSDDLLVRLPSGNGTRSAAFPVRFVYEIPSPSAGDKIGWRGSFAIEPPVLDGVGIFESHHQLYLPEGYLYTKFEGPMTLSLRDRGWARLRNVFDALLPAFGPQLDAPNEGWHPVTGISNQQRAGFDFQVPRQGQPAKLHRLGPPATIEVSFRSKKASLIVESLAFLVMAFFGFRAWRKPLPWKVAWCFGWGLASVVATGLLSPSDIRVAKAALLGVVFVACFWALLVGIALLRAVGRWFERRRAVEPAVPASPTAPPLPAQPPKPQPSPEPEPAAPAVPKPQPTEHAAPPPVSDLEFPKLETEAPDAGDKPEAK